MAWRKTFTHAEDTPCKEGKLKEPSMLFHDGCALESVSADNTFCIRTKVRGANIFFTSPESSNVTTDYSPLSLAACYMCI